MWGLTTLSTQVPKGVWIAEAAPKRAQGTWVIKTRSGREERGDGTGSVPGWHIPGGVREELFPDKGITAGLYALEGQKVRAASVEDWS